MIGSIHIQLAPSPSSHDPSRPHEPNLHSNHYVSVDKVVKRVDAVLRKTISGLADLTIQVRWFTFTAFARTGLNLSLCRRSKEQMG